MEIKRYDNGLVEIKAADGMFLSSLIAEDDRIFGEVFVLGKNDSIDNYSEWSVAEKEEWESNHIKSEE